MPRICTTRASEPRRSPAEPSAPRSDRARDVTWHGCHSPRIRGPSLEGAVAGPRENGKRGLTSCMGMPDNNRTRVPAGWERCELERCCWDYRRILESSNLSAGLVVSV